MWTGDGGSNYFWFTAKLWKTDDVFYSILGGGDARWNFGIFCRRANSLGGCVALCIMTKLANSIGKCVALSILAVRLKNFQLEIMMEICSLLFSL